MKVQQMLSGAANGTTTVESCVEGSWTGYRSGGHRAEVAPQTFKVSGNSISGIYLIWIHMVISGAQSASFLSSL